MRILILNWRDPLHPIAGGAEKSVLEHAKYWKKRGAQITWYSSAFPGSKKSDTINEIDIIRAGNHYSVHLIFALQALSGKFKGYDVVIDCFHFIPFFTPLFMRKNKKIAIVQERAGKLWFHNLLFPLSLIGYISEPVFFRLYKNVKIITGSQSAKEEITQMGIPQKNINVINHGIDRIGVNVKKEKKPTILYLGLLTKDKGFEDACIAASLVKKEIPELNFWIAGKEGKKGNYNWYAGAVKKFASNFGYVPEKKKYELLGKAWILVHPSEKEGWGLTVIEAATQGTPTVGYNVAGLRDSIKDKETGILTHKDPRELARAIISLINDKQKLDSLSLAAKSWSNTFSWEDAGRASWKTISRI